MQFMGEDDSPAGLTALMLLKPKGYLAEERE